MTESHGKVCTIVGARPQFIKAAAVSAAIRREAGFREVMIHTGQHFDSNMSDVFFSEFSMAAPDYTLGLGGGGHGAQTGRMLAALEEVLLAETPDWVLIYGDTNSTLAGALAAAKLHIPIAHVEAGLRSFNRRMPEEVNRVVADHLSTLLLTPTEAAIRHLAQEGITQGVHMVGDVMYDIALSAGQLVRDQKPKLSAERSVDGYVLSTIHRAENTDDEMRIRAIVDGLVALSRTIEVVLPLHPRTRKALTALGLMDAVTATLTILEPLGYRDMLELEMHAKLIVTDSGGVQKEAYFQRKPCVTLRDETEWVELVETGWNRLCPPRDGATIEAACRAALDTRGQDVNLYGGGNAAGQIVSLLASERSVGPASG